jgi:hypothetical protein
MDQTHSRALEALQPFIHLTTSSSSSSPRFVANIIRNATSNPHTYVFAELLETSAVQALRSVAEYQGYLTLLEIFAWGTWQEYQSKRHSHSLHQRHFLADMPCRDSKSTGTQQRANPETAHVVSPHTLDHSQTTHVQVFDVCPVDYNLLRPGIFSNRRHLLLTHNCSPLSRNEPAHHQRNISSTTT